MAVPPGWKNPIHAPPGAIQTGVDPLALLPGRRDLVRVRLEFQRRLLRARIPRLSPIRVTVDGVIFDGHHAVRAAAEQGGVVDVQVVAVMQQPVADSILALPVR